MFPRGWRLRRRSTRWSSCLPALLWWLWSRLELIGNLLKRFPLSFPGCIGSSKRCTLYKGSRTRRPLVRCSYFHRLGGVSQRDRTLICRVNWYNSLRTLIICAGCALGGGHRHEGHEVDENLLPHIACQLETLICPGSIQHFGSSLTRPLPFLYHPDIWQLKLVSRNLLLYFLDCTGFSSTGVHLTGHCGWSGKPPSSKQETEGPHRKLNWEIWGLSLKQALAEFFQSSGGAV